MKRSPRISRFCHRMMVSAALLTAAGLTRSMSAADSPAAPSADAPLAASNGLLGETFESKTAGISFRAPVGCVRNPQAGVDQLVEYRGEEKQWTLRVTRSAPVQPISLVTIKDPKGNSIPGLIDLTIDAFQISNPGTTVLRRERINVGANDCGLVVMRYAVGTQRWLRQQAMLQVNDQLYYIFNFTTPAGRLANAADDATAPPDPQEQAAVETFNGMLDTVKPLDRSDIKADQVERLYRTRAMFLNWSAGKIRSVIDPGYAKIADANLERKQYFFLFKEGKIVGYRFQHDKIENRDGLDGVVVYVRSHTEMDKDHVIDMGSNQWMGFDRRSEKWVHEAVAHTADLNAKNGWAEAHTTEVGTMEWDTKLSYAPLSGAIDPANANAERQGLPKMRPAEHHVLDVSVYGKAGNAIPNHKELPPFYLPQAAGHLLARLVLDPKPFEKRTYLFATYSSDTREIMMRYVDVEMPRRVNYKGQMVEAVPVVDKVGLEGSPTVHYITLDGTYLYAENKDEKVVIMPTTEEALRGRFKDADFSKQQDVPTAPRSAAQESSADPAAARGLPAAIR